MGYSKIDNPLYLLIRNRRLICYRIIGPSMFEGLFEGFFIKYSFLFYIGSLKLKQPINESCSVIEYIRTFTAQ